MLDKVANVIFIDDFCSSVAFLYFFNLCNFQLKQKAIIKITLREIKAILRNANVTVVERKCWQDLPG